MQTVAEITVDNFDSILSQLGNGAHDAVMETAFEVEAGAKRDAPVDTGNLRNSYQTEEVGRAQAVVYTVTEYAPHVEFGTSRMAAQPHLGPSAEAQRPLLIQRIQRVGAGLR
jgi:HK97 gp10 family phage protein